jgi:hypothetical protein
VEIKEIVSACEETIDEVEQWAGMNRVKEIAVHCEGLL